MTHTVVRIQVTSHLIEENPAAALDGAISFSG